MYKKEELVRMPYFLRCKYKGQLERTTNMSRHLPSRIVVPKTGVITRSMHRKFHPPSLVIQRCWRAWQQRKGAMDPITLCQVQPPVFVHVSPDGKETLFSANVLADFVFQTGDYRMPLTRAPFNTVEIMRLARLSGMREILDVEERNLERNARIERDSLRTFFDDEIANAIDMFSDYIEANHDIEIGFLVRHMMSMTFPPIIVTIARVQRGDSEYVADLFSVIDAKIADIRRLEGSRNLDTVMMIFEQFVEDIRTQVRHGSFVNGQSANIDIGGIQIRIDLQTI